MSSTTPAEPLRLGISTCPNDTFAYHALMTGAVDRRGLEFEVELCDVQELNERVAAGAYDVAKVSYYAALRLAREVVALPVGAALGWGVGPLLLAGAMTGAVSVLAGLSVNFADVIVVPLLLGIGVDSGIHLVHRHRGERAVQGLLVTSTPRAILWSALTTIASFGSLGFATHLGMASLGQLLCLGVVVTLAANLLFLPALLALFDRPPARLGARGRRMLE